MSGRVPVFEVTMNSEEVSTSQREPGAAIRNDPDVARAGHRVADIPDDRRMCGSH
jgi:hypothetical protein